MLLYGRGLLWIGLFCCSLTVAAESRVATYPGASVVNEEVRENTEYQLALGSITRTGGRWQPHTTERLRGDLRRVTFEVPQGHSAGEAHEFYRQQWQDRTRELLYECSGRACGNSSHWANEIFSQRELFGPDDAQRYTAMKLEVDGRAVYAALYSVQRVNRRVYVHVDWLATDEEIDALAAPDAARRLLEGQPLTLSYRGEAGWDAEYLDQVARLSSEESGFGLYVVGHAYGEDSLEELQATAREYAEEVVAALTERGMAPGRLEAHGVGPLAPESAASSSRVVLIRR